MINLYTLVRNSLISPWNHIGTGSIKDLFILCLFGPPFRMRERERERDRERGTEAGERRRRRRKRRRGSRSGGGGVRGETRDK